MSSSETVSAATVDLSALLDDMSKNNEYVRNEMSKEVIGDVAQQVQSLARMYAPRRTGALAQSIHITWIVGGAEVAPAVPYATFMEYGTGTRGEYPGQEYVIQAKKGRSLRFVMGGEVVYVKSVRMKGVAPRPFMRPAAERALEPFAEAVLSQSVKYIINTPQANAPTFPRTS